VPAVPNVTNGHAATLDEAKAKFREAWEKAKARCRD
jgi:predicted RNase H-like HicB family nuclease